MPKLSDVVFTSQPNEHAFAATRVDGTIPRDLDGTFFRSGPGLLEAGPDPLNFFDGHALLAGLSFRDGACTFRSRLVRTPLLALESEASVVVLDAKDVAAGPVARVRLGVHLPGVSHTRWASGIQLEG